MYKCCECGKKFSEEKIVINHLKCVHLIRNKTKTLGCIVNIVENYECCHFAQSYETLKAHSKKCIIVQNEIKLREKVRK